MPTIPTLTSISVQSISDYITNHGAIVSSSVNGNITNVTFEDGTTYKFKSTDVLQYMNGSLTIRSIDNQTAGNH
jgi:hypothetical protein